MSTTINLRKRARINFNKTLDTSTKKINNETTASEDEAEELIHKQGGIATSNSNILHTCLYCNKTFSQKSTSISHMNNCPKNIGTVLNENKSNINNNDADVESCPEESLNNSGDTIDKNKPSESDDNVTKNKHDVSIYDYDEEDSDDPDYNESGEESNSRHCKQCNTLFDTPLEQLRHARDCHNFPRKILSLDEVEKYFDYPNRKFCPVCEKPIKTRNFRSVFIKHLLVHTTGLTHECTVCKKKFRRRDHMRAHERRHIVPV